MTNPNLVPPDGGTDLTIGTRVKKWANAFFSKLTLGSAEILKIQKKDDQTTDSDKNLITEAYYHHKIPESVGQSVKTTASPAFTSLTLGNSLYLGDPDAEGSWRITVVSGKLAMQRLESGSWVTKQEVTA